MGAHSGKITLGLGCHLSKGIQNFIIRAFSGLQKRWGYDHTKHFRVQKTLKVLNLWKSLNYHLSLTLFQQQQQNQVVFFFILFCYFLIFILELCSLVLLMCELDTAFLWLVSFLNWSFKEIIAEQVIVVLTAEISAYLILYKLPHFKVISY